MIKREVSKKADAVKVTFSMPSDGISVVGDFNDWDASKGKLQKRSNGAFSLSMSLQPGRCYEFRYITEKGAWLNEEQADDQVDNGHGSRNSMITL